MCIVKFKDQRSPCFFRDPPPVGGTPYTKGQHGQGGEEQWYLNTGEDYLTCYIIDDRCSLMIDVPP